MSYQIRPYEDCNARSCLDIVMEVAPLVGSLASVRKGLKRAISAMNERSYGFIDDEEAIVLKEGTTVLKRDTIATVELVATVAAVNVQPLKDTLEYDTFSAISLPCKGSKAAPVGVWSPSLREAVIRHYNAMAGIRNELRQAPRYRKAGSDYIEGMLLSCSRVIMRPRLVAFTRILERKLGWASVQRSGILDIVHLLPKQLVEPERSIQ